MLSITCAGFGGKVYREEIQNEMRLVTSEDEMGRLSSELLSVNQSTP